MSAMVQASFVASTLLLGMWTLHWLVCSRTSSTTSQWRASRLPTHARTPCVWGWRLNVEDWLLALWLCCWLLACCSSLCWVPQSRVLWGILSTCASIIGRGVNFSWQSQILRICHLRTRHKFFESGHQLRIAVMFANFGFQSIVWRIETWQM